MKLLYCAECDDFVRLVKTHARSCECGESGGRYIDDSRAEVFGDALPVGFRNDTFLRAALERTDEWPGPEFVGYVIPRETENLVHVDREAIDGERA